MRDGISAKLNHPPIFNGATEQKIANIYSRISYFKFFSGHSKNFPRMEYATYINLYLETQAAKGA